MKRELKVSQEINENLDELFEELEERREFAMMMPPEDLEKLADYIEKNHKYTSIINRSPSVNDEKFREIANSSRGIHC